MRTVDQQNNDEYREYRAFEAQHGGTPVSRAQWDANGQRQQLRNAVTAAVIGTFGALIMASPWGRKAFADRMEGLSGL